MAKQQKPENSTPPQDTPRPSASEADAKRDDLDLPEPDTDIPLDHIPTQQIKKPTAPSNPFYGCVILLLAITTFSFIILWTLYSGLKQSSELDNFTVPDPAPLSVVTSSPEQKATLTTKLDAFASVAKNGRPITLTLTLGELNTVLELAGERGVADYRGMVLFTGIDAASGKLKADIRWKMNNLPFVQGPDRYLAGHATFQPRVENNTLELHIDTLEVPGKTVSEGFLRQLRNWPWLNLAKLKPEVRDPLAKVTRVEFAKENALLVLHCGETVSK